MADVPDEAAVVASLDAMVLGESRVVTYRTLTAALSLSTPAAKAALVSYATAHADDLVVTWAAVTAGPTVQLVRAAAPGPREVGGAEVRSASVWGVAKKAVGGEEAGVWVAEDRARECAQTKEGHAEENSLRVDRVNVLRSGTAGWNGGERKEGGAVVRQGMGGPLGGRRKVENTVENGKGKEKEKENARQAGGVPAVFAKKDKDKQVGKDAGELKAGEVKAEGAKAEGAKTPGAKTEGAKAKGKSKMTPWQAKVKRELLEREKARTAKSEKQASLAKAPGKGGAGKKGSSRPKAASAVREGDGTGKKGAPASRKTRKIEDSDEEADERGEDEEEAEDEDDVEPEALALQKEAEAEEEAAAARDDSARMEVDEGVDDVVGEEEAPVEEKDADMVIEDSGDEAETAGGTEAEPAQARKHGLGGGSASARKRVKRMVDENYTDEKGYIVSRRVAKWFDESGNEVPAHGGDADGGASPPPAAAEPRPPEPKATVRPKPKPKPKAKPAPAAPAAAKKKKANGKISSFFGKK